MTDEKLKDEIKEAEEKESSFLYPYNLIKGIIVLFFFIEIMIFLFFVVNKNSFDYLLYIIITITAMLMVFFDFICRYKIFKNNLKPIIVNKKTQKSKFKSFLCGIFYLALLFCFEWFLIAFCTNVVYRNILCVLYGIIFILVSIFSFMEVFGKQIIPEKNETDRISYFIDLKEGRPLAFIVKLIADCIRLYGWYCFFEFIRFFHWKSVVFIVICIVLHLFLTFAYNVIIASNKNIQDEKIDSDKNIPISQREICEFEEGKFFVNGINEDFLWKEDFLFENTNSRLSSYPVFVMTQSAIYKKMNDYKGTYLKISFEDVEKITVSNKREISIFKIDDNENKIVLKNIKDFDFVLNLLKEKTGIEPEIF